jgi:mannose-6-phosphate isomerase-like protein (cupin superfamily)
MADLFKKLSQLNTNKSIDKQELTEKIKNEMLRYGYAVSEINTEKPWGAYLKFSNENADSFITDFFPGLSSLAARLGDEKAALSPKLLIVSPGHRLSWQYHVNRSERWVFLTAGHYDKSETDQEKGIKHAQIGESIQFSPLERHRLIGDKDNYTLVAEIWQHIDNENLSHEGDIVRIQDDYSR